MEIISDHLANNSAWPIENGIIASQEEKSYNGQQPAKEDRDIITISETARKLQAADPQPTAPEASDKSPDLSRSKAGASPSGGDNSKALKKELERLEKELREAKQELNNTNEKEAARQKIQLLEMQKSQIERQLNEGKA